MKFGAVPRHSASTFYNGFGGSRPDYQTKQGYGIVPMASFYKNDGRGRDSYISMDNGGLFHGYEAELQPKWGAFREKKKMDQADKSLCAIPSKR
jgi:hypothetical protein